MSPSGPDCTAISSSMVLQGVQMQCRHSVGSVSEQRASDSEQQAHASARWFGPRATLPRLLRVWRCGNRAPTFVQVQLVAVDRVCLPFGLTVWGPPSHETPPRGCHQPSPGTARTEPIARHHQLVRLACFQTHKKCMTWHPGSLPLLPATQVPVAIEHGAHVSALLV